MRRSGAGNLPGARAVSGTDRYPTGVSVLVHLNSEEAMTRSPSSRFALSAPAAPAAPAALAVLAVLAPARLPAQAGFRPTYDRVSVGGKFGGLSGAANLNDAGTADWRLGWAASVDGTVWLHRYVGVRASGAWGQDSIRGAAPGVVGRRKFNKFFYDGDVVLRYPARAGSAAIIPYVLGGARSASTSSARTAPGPSSRATSEPASNTASAASACGRKAATSCTRSTATASTRPSTTSSGTAGSRCRSDHERSASHDSRRHREPARRAVSAAAPRPRGLV